MANYQKWLCNFVLFTIDYTPARYEKKLSRITLYMKTVPDRRSAKCGLDLRRDSKLRLVRCSDETRSGWTILDQRKDNKKKEKKMRNAGSHRRSVEEDQPIERSI